MSRKRSLKTSFNDIGDPNVETETREWKYHSQTCEHPSSIVYFIDCPFCKQEIKAYLWSLSGGGKRCECGAILSGWGTAHRRVAQGEPELGPLVKRECGPETGFTPDRCGR